jgi:hypothetical protein
MSQRLEKRSRNLEPSVRTLLAEPIVQALMKADGVSVAQIAALLTARDQPTWSERKTGQPWRRRGSLGGASH